MEGLNKTEKDVHKLMKHLREVCFLDAKGLFLYAKGLEGSISYMRKVGGLLSACGIHAPLGALVSMSSCCMTDVSGLETAADSKARLRKQAQAPL